MSSGTLMFIQEQGAPRSVKVVRNTGCYDDFQDVILDPTKVFDFGLAAKPSRNYAKLKTELERQTSIKGITAVYSGGREIFDGRYFHLRGRGQSLVVCCGEEYDVHKWGSSPSCECTIS